jgi:hypothetical protein
MISIAIVLYALGALAMLLMSNPCEPRDLVLVIPHRPGVAARHPLRCGHPRH